MEIARDIILKIQSTYNSAGVEEAKRSLTSLREVMGSLGNVQTGGGSGTGGPAQIAKGFDDVSESVNKANDALNNYRTTEVQSFNVAKQKWELDKLINDSRNSSGSLRSRTTMAPDENGILRPQSTTITTQLEKQMEYERRLASAEDANYNARKLQNRQQLASLIQQANRSETTLRRDAAFENSTFDAKARHQEQMIANEERMLKLHDQALSMDDRRTRGGGLQMMAAEREAAERDLAASSKTFNAGVNVAAENEKITASVTAQSQASKLAAREAKDLAAAEREAAAGAEQTGESFGHIVGKVAVWSVATGLIFGTVRAGESLIKNFAQIEMETTKLSFAHDRGMQSAKNIRDAVLDLGVAYGQSANESMMAATTFARLGLNDAEVIKATQTAMVAANLSGEEMGKQTEMLVSVMESFKLHASDLPMILDQMAVVAKNTAKVSIDELADSAGKAGAVFHAAGGSLVEFNAIVGIVAQDSSAKASQIGTTLRTIANNMGRGEVQDRVSALTGGRINIQNEKGDIDGIMNVLKKVREFEEHATPAQVKQLNYDLAGRQANYLYTILEKLPDVQALVVKEMNSQGDAARMSGPLLDTLSKRWDALNSAWEKFAGSSNGMNPLKGLMGDATNLLNAMTEIDRLAAKLMGSGGGGSASAAGESLLRAGGGLLFKNMPGSSLINYSDILNHYMDSVKGNQERISNIPIGQEGSLIQGPPNPYGSVEDEKAKAEEKRQRNFENGAFRVKKLKQEAADIYDIEVNNLEDPSNKLDRARAKLNEAYYMKEKLAEMDKRGDFVDPEDREEINRSALKDTNAFLIEQAREEDKIQKELLKTQKERTKDAERHLKTTKELLGALSDEDLLRVQLLAADIQSGKQKPLTQSEFLGMDQRSRELYLKADRAFPGVGLVPNLDLGFGQNAFMDDGVHAGRGGHSRSHRNSEHILYDQHDSTQPSHTGVVGGRSHAMNINFDGLQGAAGVMANVAILEFSAAVRTVVKEEIATHFPRAKNGFKAFVRTT